MKTVQLIVLGVIGILLIAGITIATAGLLKKTTPKQADKYEGMPFIDICRQTGGMWMIMQPTKNGIPTGQKACAGCMQRTGDHICDQTEYLTSLSK